MMYLQPIFLFLMRRICQRWIGLLWGIMFVLALTACTTPHTATSTPAGSLSPVPPSPTALLATVIPNPTHTPAPRISSTPAPSPDPTLPPKVKLPCTPQGAFAKCVDETLNIEFEYPIAWGEIEVDLRVGGYAGYAYDYFFSEITPPQVGLLAAGGRSKDFSEGRGGMPTDFSGYENISSAMRCSQINAFYLLCQEIKPNVVWMIRFPDSEYFCFRVAADAPPPTFNPVVRIEINLPQNPTIQGFVFEAPFLSEELSDELTNDLLPLLGRGPHSTAIKCEASDRQAYDNQLQDFIELVQSNSLDDGTIKNLEALMHLAKSITFK